MRYVLYIIAFAAAVWWLTRRREPEGILVEEPPPGYSPWWNTDTSVSLDELFNWVQA